MKAAANRSGVARQPIEYLLIGHGGEVDDCFVTGTAEAALGPGGHFVPGFGAGGRDG